MRRRSTPTVGLALALSTGLVACSAESGPPTLTWYTIPDGGGTQVEMARNCTEASDGAYRVEISLLPNDAASQREQLARRLAAEDASIDIMSVDPPFIPELSEPGFLAPVPEDLVETFTGDVVQGAVDSATWDGEVVAAPYLSNTMLLWYRKSVVEEAGLDMSQPVTWDQIIEVARDTGTYLGVQGTKAESLTVWVNALVASQGEEILPNPEVPADELEVNLDSDAGRRAAEIMSTIAGEGLGGPGMPTENEDASVGEFLGDNGSFMVNWPFAWPAANDTAPDVVEDIGWARYPRVDPDTPSTPPVGGLNMAVGAFTEHPDLAWDAVECLRNPDHQALFVERSGNVPVNAEVYDRPEIQEAYPMADLLRESLEEAVPRPQTPYYNEVSIGLQETWYPMSDIDPDRSPEVATDLITGVLRGERLL
ncbi:carbohydrate ABC transporter substrate-binding protein, CUT1 family [Georgenia satyanarayanai]|uniref:Carbohydrate ABC transporter substrate-binding protein, CUT1 family n=1 Tax=Georgenia satyanarayanai TaxID=860221 RepID=A0A2Y9A9C9_9MICO|nr:extracellular solute-binding protein [Georgenia satyanarayanai]PYG00254.1 carbohydrate ABC transporter substrate-binding protein (CUT1 family) [Georgenia satyanarayanai]SSA40576.1 carbohydrate ABC transporter substrate-binding protein, CUT1 family [Georgenia satyanarayanai]